MAFEIHGATDSVRAVCLGAGRFLRCLLVPALRQLGHGVVVAQPRGHDFVDACLAAGGTYEMDVVERDGHTSTHTVELAGVGTLGTRDGRAAFLELPYKLPHLRYIGVGVTEAGIQAGSQAMADFAAFLATCSVALPHAALSVINTDNLPANGDAIKALVLALCTPDVAAYIDAQVTFHNSMVDRITAGRPSNALVPFSEPLPPKALVLEDSASSLDTSWAALPGVIVLRTCGDLSAYHKLKLNIANATHTAMVYCLALSRVGNTTATHEAVYTFLDELFRRDIAPALVQHNQIPAALVQSVYDDQNAFTKFQIRLWPSVLSNLACDAAYQPSAMMALATAFLLRFLTPAPASEAHTTERGPIFTGFMDPTPTTEGRCWNYVGDLSADSSVGRYTFRDGNGSVPSRLHNASSTSIAVLAVLETLPGCDWTRPTMLHFAADVAALYHRLLTTPALRVLEDVLEHFQAPRESALTSPDAVAASVQSHVTTTPVIDVHTHLFPPSHDALMLWGIDALLTYHYLVAEYLSTATTSPEAFYALPGTAQADAVWQHLFCDRSPLSEACQGVITTLFELGLASLVATRDLRGIRAWFDAQSPTAYVDRVFRLAKVRYVVMTNIPFDPLETQYWTPTPARCNRSQFKTALRIDQLLLGLWSSIGPALDTLHLPHTLDGVEQFLLHWIDVLQPEYFMASVPHTFVYDDDSPRDAPRDLASPSGALLLSCVVLPLAARLSLPIALKFGAVRGLNPRLCLAGDGVAVVDVSLLTRLARANPRVKFLATFLSRVNQHEVTVVANKFANVHLYGCWWYCNNPSITSELTRMRLEMLGTGFTAQHSDARVLDQLVYKWKHFRSILATTLTPLYTQLLAHGWVVTDEDIRRDVSRLLGGSYEAFLAKRLDE
ncbi:hypothetical protein SPRG_08260 [Saprolegnia parasitica CBS 223.65]|uniref:Mannitol dehydrogenase N-terminal domain-containing protein n=1 Tax=Saprolegnia parasitica (strain CBS 223.65) TaxID=695850 RepID=A0A067CI14_SAPPC|nr:hypothetical protein SPRG_08260 [Saprolegnia parasitica CBS 223.65]KDO26457.1 hypothetical protein SPRG_08260 [Saprolegnia parasitica CBS 223.65]|eukprot:XP_012202892.1 hypothetical protein SPRG_08260 [Saprolegnia parasitica CBS 223.65]